MKVANAKITWVDFNNEFMEKYFLADDRSHKENELLELKQGNMIVADHATKFEELSMFYPHYNGADAEGSKCVKFESGLCPEITPFIWYQEIRHFSVLVNKCIIYDEDSRARSAHYKSVSEKNNENKNRGTPYMTTIVEGNHKPR